VAYKSVLSFGIKSQNTAIELHQNKFTLFDEYTFVYSTRNFRFGNINIKENICETVSLSHVRNIKVQNYVIF